MGHVGDELAHEFLKAIARPLYERVEDARKAKGWTAVQLSQASGVARTTIDRWKTQPRPPQAAKVIPVADALGIDRDEALRLAGLLSGQGPPQPRVSEEARRQILAAPSSELAKLLMVLWDKFGDEAFYPALVEVLAIRRGDPPPAPNQVSDSAERDRSRSPERVE